LLAAEDIASYLVYPGLPAHEIIKLVRRLQPTFLGVSIALKKHVRAIQDLLAAIEKIPGDERPILIAGGYSIRSGLSLDPALRVNSFADAKSFLNAMRPLVPRVDRAA
jgi:hypothetical protein